MQLLYDSFIERFPADLKDRLQLAIMHQTDLNPVARLQSGISLVLKETIHEVKELEKLLTMKIDITSKRIFSFFKNRKKMEKKKLFIQDQISFKKELAFELASLSCYLLPKMKSSEEFVDLLKEINHPYIDLFIAYFEEGPTNYQAIREKVDLLAAQLEKNPNLTLEMQAHIYDIRSWVYGQQGDIKVLKEIYKYARGRLLKSTNIIEISALLDAIINVIWWTLHSGLESNIDEMINFVEPYVIKYKLYVSFTDFLNLKGAVLSYFGDNAASIKCFEELMKEHEKYNDNYRLSIAMGNLAESYFTEGKILQAKKMMEKAIKLYLESTGKWPYLYLMEIGNMYYLTDNPKAEESFLHAYEIQKKEKSLYKAFILFELIHFYLRSEKLTQAHNYLNEMKDLAKDLGLTSVNAQVDYILGYYELLEQNFTNALKYMQTSLDLAQQSKEMDLILSCNIQLALIYLQKYRINEEQDIFNSALNHIDTAIQLAIENDHNQILSAGLVIRAILLASQGHYEKSFSDIQLAKKITIEIDYNKWIDDIQKIEKSIKKSKQEGKVVLDKESVLKYIIPQFKSILSFKLVERKPKKSEVIGLLVISESGVPIYTKIGKNLKTDKMILSGLLTAINQLAESVIEGKNKGRLQEVLYDKFWIVVQPIKNGIVAVIASDDTAEIRMWASSIANKIKEVPIVITELTSDLEKQIIDIINQMNIK